MNFKLVPTNNVVVEVTPESGWTERTPEQEYNEGNSLKREIDRHVDNGGTYVRQTYEYIHDDESFETLYDAISDVILDCMFSYSVTGKARKEEEYPTGIHCYSFKDVLEEVYRHPYECKVEGELTEKEIKAIQMVIDFRLK